MITLKCKTVVQHKHQCISKNESPRLPAIKAKPGKEHERLVWIYKKTLSEAIEANLQAALQQDAELQHAFPQSALVPYGQTLGLFPSATVPVPPQGARILGPHCLKLPLQSCNLLLISIYKENTSSAGRDHFS